MSIWDYRNSNITIIPNFTLYNYFDIVYNTLQTQFRYLSFKFMFTFRIYNESCVDYE